MEECVHTNVVMDGNNKTCTDCGMQLNKIVTFEKEWRFYGNNDSKHVSDPNRCNIRKTEDRSIAKDVHNLGFGDKIISIANDIYEKTTQNRIFRGSTRKGIIFACIFHAYKAVNNPKSCEQLIEIFEIDRKVALKGLKYVNLNIPREYLVNRPLQLDCLITELMQKFNASMDQIQDVLSLYHQVKNKSSLLNRSRPQSVASGIFWYYIVNKNPDISIDYILSRIPISELTITKIAKEIERIQSK